MTREKVEISHVFDPTILRDFNRSGFLDRKEFSLNKIGGKIRALKKCADARVHCILPAVDTAHFTTIAAADPTAFAPAYSHPGYSSIVDYTHFAGDTGFPLKGCGGLAEWQKLSDKGDVRPQELQGAASYVWNEIRTADPFFAAFQDAMAIATLTNKPIFFGSLDHLTAQLYIAGLAVNQGGTPQYYSPIDFNHYDPQEVYRGEFPVIHPGQIPNTKWAEELALINRQNREKQQQIFADNPEFIQSQKVQNPGLIYISDQPHSLRLIMPGIAENPNSDFSLRVVKTKRGNGRVVTDPTKVLQQLEYPIVHSVQSQDAGSGAFHNSKHILITTEDIDLSKDIAKKACKEPYMKPWLERGGRIIIAGVQKGEIKKPSDIAAYRP